MKLEVAGNECVAGKAPHFGTRRFLDMFAGMFEKYRKKCHVNGENEQFSGVIAGLLRCKRPTIGV